MLSVFTRNVAMRYLIVLLISVPLSLSASAQALPPQSDFHLYLLIGQSNMAGRGKVAPQDRQPIPRIVMLDKQNQWVPAVDPIHFDKPKVIGVGLGRSFAAVVAEANPDATIGLIPCAVGGSPISSWQPGGFHRQTKTHPYDDMLPRLRLARKQGTLKAILWHQGESDSKAELAPLYEAELLALIKRLRDEVGDAKMPFIAGQMGRFSDKPWDEHREAVDAVHQALPGKVANTAFVSSEGLNHKGDKVHFDAASYRELGRRYAKAYLEMQQ